jgi:hypothetical protein
VGREEEEEEEEEDDDDDDDDDKDRGVSTQRTVPASLRRARMVAEL